MDKIENIEDFYLQKFNKIPDDLQQEIGHFNVFRLEPFVGEQAKPVPYKRRDYYKISLVIGKSRVHYADKVVEIQKQALVFSNPLIPFKWENLESVSNGAFCVFNQSFFHQYGNLNQYEVFLPNGTHVFELTDDQLCEITSFYERMFMEKNSEYLHKDDILRTVVLEILHYAMKMQPAVSIGKQQINSSQRISMLFQDLLERQFPIDESYQQVKLRSASDFAKQLNIHVSHLNRVIKSIYNKTTTQIIAERILQEAKVLLKYSVWNVSEIAYALGFTETTHFNNFFKKYVQTSPLKFRNA